MKDKKSEIRKEQGSSGEKVSVAFNLLLNGRRPLFVHHGVVEKFTGMLRSEAEQQDCIISVYCFMPDHQHFIVSGAKDTSGALRVADSYKQSTGKWMSENIPAFSWQTDHHNHVLSETGALADTVKYILDNPVRQGLVSSWQNYPFKGAIRCSLEDALSGEV